MFKKMTFFSLLMAAIIGVKIKMMKKGQIGFMCRKRKMSPGEKLSKMIHKICSGARKRPRHAFLWGR